jgi:hypothetical protein
MRKTIVAMFAPAAVGLFQPTVASAKLAAIGLATALTLTSTTALAMGGGGGGAGGGGGGAGAGGGGGGGSTYTSGAQAAPAATCVRHRVCKDGHCTVICR